MFRAHPYSVLLLFLFLSTALKAQQLEIIDISQKQIRLYNQFKNADSKVKKQIFRDSLYYPYEELWKGYVNGLEGFDLTVKHYGTEIIDSLNKKNQFLLKEIDKSSLTNAFHEIQSGMEVLTGLKPIGKWYLLFGPSLTNLGSVGNGVLFIDFLHPANKDLESVKEWFPHELNHQIYDNTCPDTVYNVLNRCVNEGFAVYVNQLYWNEIALVENYSLARSLAYTDQELQNALSDWDYIKSVFAKNYTLEDKKSIDKFGARNQKLKKTLPGAIGYLIGYKIVESYVRIYGKDSWKDIYYLSSKDVLIKSRFLMNE